MIYTITCIRITKSLESNFFLIHANFNPELFEQYNKRCWGYYTLLENAVKAVEENYSDMCEDNYYQYAVIEAYEQGVPAISEKSVFWFKWDIEKEKYISLEKPEYFNGIKNWAIG